MKPACIMKTPQMLQEQALNNCAEHSCNDENWLQNSLPEQIIETASASFVCQWYLCVCVCVCEEKERDTNQHTSIKRSAA